LQLSGARWCWATASVAAHSRDADVGGGVWPVEAMASSLQHINESDHCRAACFPRKPGRAVLFPGKPAKRGARRRGRGVDAALLFAGSGAHEHACGKGALPMQRLPASSGRPTRRPCGRSDRAKR